MWMLMGAGRVSALVAGEVWELHRCGSWVIPCSGGFGNTPGRAALLQPPPAALRTWDRNLSPSTVTPGEARQEGRGGTAQTMPASCPCCSQLNSMNALKGNRNPFPSPGAEQLGAILPHLKALGRSSLSSGTLHDAGKSQEWDRTEQGQP